MRIGVITPYNAPNYGAFLQAFCLKYYLQQMGHEVVHVQKKDTRKPITPSNKKRNFFRFNIKNAGSTLKARPNFLRTIRSFLMLCKDIKQTRIFTLLAAMRCGTSRTKK